MKALADDISNVAVIMISLFERAENTVGKRENAGYQLFSFYHSVFKSIFLTVVKSRDCD